MPDGAGATAPPTAARPAPSAGPLLPGAPALSAVGQTSREGAVAAVVALGAIAVLAMWWHDTSPTSLDGWGNWLTGAGRLTALLGTYLVVVGIALMARIPWLDRLIGMDRLTTWHRRNGEYSVSLLASHPVLIVWGYALSAHEGVVHETATVVLHYPDVLMATAAWGLLLLIGVLSTKALRRRISYQAWYFVHLYAYLALALAFAHSFTNGEDFATHPVNRAAWIALYAAVGLLVLTFRVAKPLRDALRHRMRVARVVPEGPGVVSIWVTGRGLGALRASAGQFFLWRWLTRDGWWQAHPYSLSAVPDDEWLRITVKGLGDHSADLVANLAPGTRVLAEGPYGSMTPARRRMRKVLLVAGGVGITPLRTLLEALPGDAGEVSLIYRATTEADLVLRAEIDQIAAARGARVLYLVGSHEHHPDWLGAAHLRALVPDLADHDVYLCGPLGLVDHVERSLAELAVPRRRIHVERFALAL